jgi:hypothetical protein
MAITAVRAVRAVNARATVLSMGGSGRCAGVMEGVIEDVIEGVSEGVFVHDCRQSRPARVSPCHGVHY